ncbi:GerAB/ArcD/ProY family transporter [Clostridium sp. DJ247]|nr:GerAB/ArcD/ProY family transporter [Clostridium sp. DJ247]
MVTALEGTPLIVINIIIMIVITYACYLGIEAIVFTMISPNVNSAKLAMKYGFFAILILIIGGFTKITVFTYASIIGFADIFKVKNHRVFIIPVCVVIIISSLLIASSFTQHIEIGLEILPKYAYVPIYVIIPIFLGVLTYIKHKKRVSNK